MGNFTSPLVFVVLEGFEPSQAEPESDVLPLHHRTFSKPLQRYCFFLILQKNQHFFLKKIAFSWKKHYSRHFELLNQASFTLKDTSCSRRYSTSCFVTGILNFDRSVTFRWLLTSFMRK